MEGEVVSTTEGVRSGVGSEDIAVSLGVVVPESVVVALTTVLVVGSVDEASPCIGIEGSVVPPPCPPVEDEVAGEDGVGVRRGIWVAFIILSI